MGTFLALLPAWRLRAVPSPTRILHAGMRARDGAAHQSLASEQVSKSPTTLGVKTTDFYWYIVVTCGPNTWPTHSPD